MSDALSRRSLLAASLPAAAIGVGLIGRNAFAQDAPAPGELNSAVLKMLASLNQNGMYALPKLPYAYNALEPHIDAQTMELHHSKHQQSYVTNLNNSIDALGKLRDAEEIDGGKLSALSRDISFNAGGAIFHTIFFGTMGAPRDVDAPIQLLGDINKQYGSLDKFKAHFSKVAGGVKGSGWAIACYEPIGEKILITETGDQDLRLIPGSIPLLLIDVWEHAYYLKYQNKRADYIEAWWNVVNWTEVDALYAHVRKIFGK